MEIRDKLLTYVMIFTQELYKKHMNFVLCHKGTENIYFTPWFYRANEKLECLAAILWHKFFAFMYVVF